MLATHCTLDHSDMSHRPTSIKLPTEVPSGRPVFQKYTPALPPRTPLVYNRLLH